MSNHPLRPKIVGLQLHHSVALEDATRGAANMLAGLESALRATGNHRMIDVRWRLEDAVGELQELRDEAQQRLRAMPVEKVRRCRDGLEPWPDELRGGFQARCTCNDLCRVHELGADEDVRRAAGWHCQCDPCPQHGDS